MRKIGQHFAVILVISTLLFQLGGCASSRPDREPRADRGEIAAATDDEAKATAETAQAEKAPATASAVKKEQTKPVAEAKKPPSEDDLKKKRKELVKKERKLAKLQRSLKVAQLKLDMTRISHANANRGAVAALAKAEADHELALRRFKNFQEKNVPSRIGWSELGLQRATDRTGENQEELEQLEIMYREDEFAEQTKEIVIERARRRLVRSQRDLELRGDDFATLTEETIPLEQRDHELRIIAKENSLKQAQEKIAIGAFDQQIAIINAEGELIRLNNELDDTHEEIEELQEKIVEMEKEIAETEKKSDNEQATVEAEDEE